MIKPEEWRPIGIEQLEPNAHNAATFSDRNLLVTAGPGAGKTEVLAQRADFLLRTGTTPYPRRILAISFKADASKNLKDRVKKRSGLQLARRFDSYTFHAFSLMLIDKFRPALTGLDALDPDYTIGDVRVTNKQITYDDFLPLAISILENCSYAIKALQATYTDIFLDEFQDCTDRQYHLLKLAFSTSNARIIAVGDIKQRIMGWANALEGVFNHFHHDFNTTVTRLYFNYRSQMRLQRMQNEIVRSLEPEAARELEEESDDGEIAIVECPNCDAEASFIRDQIQKWIDEGIPISEIAILVRNQPRQFLQKVITKLVENNIPFREEYATQDLMQQPVCIIIIDYLLILFGEREPQAWTRFSSMLNTLENSDESKQLSSVIKALINKNTERIKLSPENYMNFDTKWQLVNELLSTLTNSRLAMLSHEYQKEARLQEIITQTQDVIRSSLINGYSFIDTLRAGGEIAAVRLLTIHKAKGLEFEAVIIQSIEEETFWGDNRNENLCTYFVGVSRAKNRLTLTYCLQRECPTGLTAYQRNRWSEVRTPQQEYLDYARAVAP
ncbi:UvrD-helicase domain-containing protein [Oleidesulfovibrio alaskensis]|uniref:UvrD-helicase domain-containing protein n=1 Tax=Oleidesulfovibrio alaskensis TaxID=58180 RepID=UPI000401B859|nr:ATP-dependent helicase [Oleidesulfovibrio alaskensis]